ncbi:hypothetical protein T492DRAFT_936591 [Pavlovales sp. CCMP2436]|nr:hypothetical protein T492DRAFT_936591 [Pavlovales sp. CCMP2436]
MMLTSSADGERAEPLLACAEDEHDDDEAHKLESQRKLKWAVGLALLFMGIEIAGGILAHSLAILTDAAHMLSDVAGFIVSIVALALTSRPPNGTFSFGYHRAEVLGAMLSIFAVWHAQGHGGHEESVQRTDAHAHDHGHKGSCKEPKPFAHHPPGDHAHAHGTRAAGVDTHSADVESGEPPSGAGHRVGVPAAAISSFDRLRTLAGFPTAAAQPTPVTGGYAIDHRYRVDPVCTLLSAVLVLHSTWATLSECTMVLMCAVPGHIDSNDVHRRLLAMPEVIEVHDLHIWAVSPHKLNLSAHIVVRPSTDQTTVLYSAQAVAKRVGVNHTVFQVEDSALFNCSAHAGWPCLKRTSPDAAGPQ